MASKIKGKKAFTVYVDEPIHRAIKIYAVETHQNIYDVLKPFQEEFIQSVLKLITQVKEMQQRAEQKRLQEEEESRIIAEHPLPVTGIPIEPITEIIDPQTC